MDRSLLRWAPAGVLVAAPALVLAGLQLDSAADARLTLAAPEGHFYIVSAAAVFAAIGGLIAGLAVLRSANLRVLLLSLSFLSMALIFTIHGLSTPGFVVDGRFYGVTGFSARLSLLVAAAFLAASAVDWPQDAARRVLRWKFAVLAAWAAGIVSYGALTLFEPEALPPAITNDEAVKTGTAIAVIWFGGFAAARYFRGFRRSELPLYGAVAVGSMLLVEAQLAMHLATVWHATFWLYHVQLLLAFGAVLWGVGTEYLRGIGPIVAVERLGMSDPLQQIRAGYAGPIRSLAAALEARDGYTIGHSERVAALAVMMGEHMGLPAGRLRALAQGSLLHDVGKIGVPDSVLHKAGGLTDEEFELIKEHPARGDALLSSARGERVERTIVRHHHERMDGTGYPDGLAGEAIPLEARIAAVADVYDALRSTRSYRESWTREAAIELIDSETGTHFDERCVEAFTSVVDRWEREFVAGEEAYAQRRIAA